MSEIVDDETCEICHRLGIFDQLEKHGCKDRLLERYVNICKRLTFGDGQKSKNTDTITVCTANIIVDISI